MRERLTIAFILLTVGVLAGALLIRSYSLQTDVRAREDVELRREAVVARLALEQHLELDRPVDTAFLTDLVGNEEHLVYVKSGDPTLTVTGRDYDDGGSGATRVETEIEDRKSVV